MKGVIAGGSPENVRAGLYAFEQGGNAFDALIAAQLSAFVSEPLLTGFAGAGMATITQMQHGTLDAHVVDMFTAMPGMEKSGKFPTSDVYINFGQTKQKFSVGEGAVAVPTMHKGLAYVHKEYATLPLDVLARPAIEYAQKGTPVSKGLRYVIELLHPIIQLSPVMLRWLCSDKNTIHCPEMEEDIRNFVVHTENMFGQGLYGKGINTLHNSKLSQKDIESYTVQKRKAITQCVPNREEYSVICPDAPSIGGQIISNMITHSNFPSSTTSVEWFAHLHRLQKQIHRDVFVTDTIQRLQSAGYTTHISATDEAGNSIGLTSSLGETAGMVLPGTGIMLNNFLGEDDVAPIAAQNCIGARLLTMCAPTILHHKQTQDRYVFGSGGSSRIPSAISQTIAYMLHGNLSLEDAIRAPRMHSNGDSVQIESHGLSPDITQYLHNHTQQLSVFPEANLYFGGVHAVGYTSGRFIGVGDARRSGCVAECVQ